MANRRILGLGLLVASVIAACIIQLLTGQLVHVETFDQNIGQSGYYSLMASVTVFNYRSGYALLLAVCYVIGLALLLWPSRKPPRLA
jgi:hypothetical protein